MKLETFELLVRAAVPQRQARAIAQAIERECRAHHDSLATKFDLAGLREATTLDFANLRTETKSDFAQLRAETKSDFAQLRTETKSDFANFRAEMYQLVHGVKSELVRWIFLVILGQTAALAAGGYFYINSLLR